MLRQVLDAHGGTLPARCEAVFANTGRECPETLDFIAALSDRWHVSITWLEFDHDAEARGATKYKARVVTRETASLDGKPFDALLRVGWLPSVTRRICTSELKVGTIDRYLWQRHKLTKRQTRKLIGFRADEPNRWKPALYQACEVAYPMVEAGVTVSDVSAFWQAQDFDLGIPSGRGRTCLPPSARNRRARIGGFRRRNGRATRSGSASRSRRYAMLR